MSKSFSKFFFFPPLLEQEEDRERDHGTRCLPPKGVKDWKPSKENKRSFV